MATIIVIVVVALVFFVTVCVVTFMVWKRETEMRTDSIRAIESNLEKLGDRLAGETETRAVSGGIAYGQDIADISRRRYAETPEFRRRESKDPFGWIRENGSESEKEKISEEYVSFTETKEMNREKSEPAAGLESGASSREEDTRISERFTVSPDMPEAVLQYDSDESDKITVEDQADIYSDISDTDGKTPETDGKTPEYEALLDEAESSGAGVASEIDSFEIDLPELRGALPEDETDVKWPAAAAEQTEGAGNVHKASGRVLDGTKDDQSNNAEMTGKIENTGEHADSDSGFGIKDSGLKYGDFPADSFADINDIDMIGLEENRQASADENVHAGHDVGRSGKRYTAEELDMLIKE